MARSLFVCGFDAVQGRPSLPDDAQMIGGVPGYGWVTISYTPISGTCLVEVNSSDAVTDALKAGETAVWIADIEG